jgi:hypothetical protein
MISIDRRRLLSAGIASAGAVQFVFSPASGIRSQAWALGQSDKIVIEQWMTQWMSAARAPEGALYLGRFKDPIYFLREAIAWKPNSNQAGSLREVDVPVGFITDFASIPRLFWSLLRPDGEYTYPAIIHDYLYWTQTRTRAESDEIFRLAMADFDIDAVTATTLYDAVRVGGSTAWRENARLKSSGEKRILKKFPDDPRVSWEQWKKRPGVFAP